MRIVASCLVLLLVACAGSRESDSPPAADADTGSAITPPPRDAAAVGAPYLVEVEEVECPHTAAYGSTLTVRLRGVIGNNGCHHLHEIKVTRPDESTVVVEPYGIFEGGPMCTQNIVMLDEAVEVADLPESDFTLEVRRGNGEALRFPITIER
jgi:hypothetical protein